VRRALIVVLLALVAPAPAAAAISLAAHPATPRFGASVTLSGKASPGDDVQLFFDGSATGEHVTANGSGAFAFGFAATQPGAYHVEAAGSSSPPVALRLRPILTRHRAGLPYPGSRLVLAGRLRPTNAGSLTLKVGTRSWHVRVASSGRYKASLPTDRIGRHRARLIIGAHAGFKGFSVHKHFRILAPSLASGSRGTAVLALERRLKALHHVLRGPDRYYGTDTYDAVLAFQKVHGMARTGRVSRGV